MSATTKRLDVVAGSFRDPAGRVLTDGERILRQVNAVYASHYDRLMASGLYERLVADRLLVAHAERPESAGVDVHRLIEPERIPFISYPFEWGFGQLKAAALTTLEVQRLAIRHGMVLKDASAYNVQFIGARPTLIDTLSFETWTPGAPWVAYKQFCQHFLGPLALMSRTDIRLGGLSRLFIDGTPLDLVNRLLPMAATLRPSLFVHVKLHANAQQRHGDRPISDRSPTSFSERAMLGLIDHLQSAIESLRYEETTSVWGDYYSHTNYSGAARADKERLVRWFVETSRPRIVWDLGANTGVFSRIAADQGAYTVALDSDGLAVERLYRDCAARRDARILPLVMDLANPTSRLGWAHAERQSLADRGPADLVLALGLIHHLCLANQVPLVMAASFLARLGRALVIEFIPRTDSQVAGMLSRMPRPDAYYSVAAFEREFAGPFTIAQIATIADSERRLYLMRAKGAPS